MNLACKIWTHSFAFIQYKFIQQLKRGHVLDELLGIIGDTTLSRPQEFFNIEELDRNNTSINRTK